MGWLSLHVILSLFATAAFGGMLLLMVSFAPATFCALEQRQASRFRRHLFPRYYFILTVILALAAGFLVPGGGYRLEITIFVGCGGVFFALLHILLPQMDALREVDQTAFNRPHRASFFVPLAQFRAVTIGLVWPTQ